MFDYSNKDPFYDEYIELLVNRITHSTMELEKDLGNPDDSKNAIRLRDNIRAFKYLIRNADQVLSEEIIIRVANLINDSSIYISNGYRNIGKYLADSDIPISNPENIPNDMKQLLNDYYYAWKDLDPYEREAKFHIQFIKIHPFEDGNGRTSRLLLNFNLLKQNLPPVIITDELDENYKKYIYDESIEEMANLFRIESHKERTVFEEIKKENHLFFTDETKGISLK